MSLLRNINKSNDKHCYICIGLRTIFLTVEKFTFFSMQQGIIIRVPCSSFMPHLQNIRDYQSGSHRTGSSHIAFLRCLVQQLQPSELMQIPDDMPGAVIQLHDSHFSGEQFVTEQIVLCRLKQR